MSVPSTMYASVLTGPKRVELESRPVPSPGEGGVLIKVTAVGVCGSDTHFFESDAVGDIVVRDHVVLGHETAGEIVAVGAGVDASRVGTRVAVEPQTPCRACRFCKRGAYHLCPSIRFFGAWPVDGSFAEFVIVDADFAHEIPSAMTDEQAALAEPVSVAIHAARRAGVTAGARVLITGAGPIGVLTAQVAKSFGAVEVVISDPIAKRRDFARARGADEVIDSAGDGLARFDQYFDIYIDASGSAQAIRAALPTIVRGGIAVLVGMGGNQLDVPVAMLQHREITLTGTFRYVNTWPTAIDLISRGIVDTSGIVTGRYGLDGVEDALMKAKTDPEAIKTMIIPALTVSDARTG
ncbi:NAD(P)-dependent alcohol dehydrogenase [Microbacterium aurugineum]|uniref:NAD(P)-dependent alcohol dehydrogenase n=1 Tax=Microbacterium aurugineum TaxID=2851642 RepID=UPI0039BE522B